jgi:WD40 repeat protein
VLAFSPDGSLLASRESKSLVHLIASSTGELLAVLEAPGGDHVAGLVFSPDSRYLAQLQTSVRELIVWDLQRIREQLAKLHLDWGSPLYPAKIAPPAANALRVERVQRPPMSELPR